MTTSTVRTFEHTKHLSKCYLGHCEVLQVVHRDGNFQFGSIPPDWPQSGPEKVEAQKKKWQVNCWRAEEIENVNPRKKAEMARISSGKGRPPSAQ